MQRRGPHEYDARARTRQSWNEANLLADNGLVTFVKLSLAATLRLLCALLAAANPSSGPQHVRLWVEGLCGARALVLGSAVGMFEDPIDLRLIRRSCSRVCKARLGARFNFGRAVLLLLVRLKAGRDKHFTPAVVESGRWAGWLSWKSKTQQLGPVSDWQRGYQAAMLDGKLEDS